MLPNAIGFVDDGGLGTIIEVGSVSMERMVRYLAGLPLPCEVLHPAELRMALRDHGAGIVAANP
jgi:predicted DNA-binding transcriptional regulator YafY